MTLSRVSLSSAPGICYPSDLDPPTTLYRLGAPISPGDVFAEVKRAPGN